eukprot:TRINITY_DN26696_c0_g1_i2.p1 TRINITY_DN26696_c0_g1~~TRINITY_DN26696_c0_g1_i2.p1  ORF type:complete len:236 (-),score=4.73 TRINITY_DN26696_c0_g1_i2:7-714(-)
MISFTFSSSIVFYTILSIILSLSNAETDAVTCGSAVKLQHKETGMLLHSHPIGWGSGSGQQSVTTQTLLNDQNDLWLISNGIGEPFCDAGTPIECGSKIRLTHVGTQKNLHSHLFKAALSGYQEVSCFGESGNGDTGDNWIVECGFVSKEVSTNNWNRDAVVSFKHVDTNKYLYTSKSVKFTTQNCGQQCPIMGQTEISASNKKEGAKTQWFTTQGVFFPPKGETRDIDEYDEEL